MKRIFIAIRIEPAETLLEMISAFRTGLKDERIKWTDIQNFHITLAFPGNTEEDKIKEISKMLRRVCAGYGEFAVVIKGAGIFKSFSDPRIIRTGVEPSEELSSLFDVVRKGLKETGITIEDRPFNPHLTFGRIKGVRDNGRLKSLIAGYQDTVIQKSEIKEVILYESQLFSSGPVYKPLGKYALS